MESEMVGTARTPSYIKYLLLSLPRALLYNERDDAKMRCKQKENMFVYIHKSPLYIYSFAYRHRYV